MSFLPLPWPNLRVPTLWKVEFTCPPTSTVAQILRFCTLWQVQFTCSAFPYRDSIFYSDSCDKLNSHVLPPLLWHKLRFWFFYKFNSHVFLPLPWPNLRFWLCDKFNSHVLQPLPWPKFRFWLQNKFNSHVHLPLPINPICDSDFVTSSIHMSSHPYRGLIHDFDFVKKLQFTCSSTLTVAQFAILTLWQVQFTCSPTPTVAQFAILTLWQVQFTCLPTPTVAQICDSYFVTSSIHMSSYPYRGPNLRFWLCQKFNSHVLPTPTVAQFAILTLIQV